MRYQIRLYEDSLFSLIFRKGNGHVVTYMVWWDIMPVFVRGASCRDRSGLPNFHFRYFFFFLRVWFGPPLVHIFPFFLYI